MGGKGTIKIFSEVMQPVSQELCHLRWLKKKKREHCPKDAEEQRGDQKEDSSFCNWLVLIKTLSQLRRKFSKKASIWTFNIDHYDRTLSQLRCKLSSVYALFLSNKPWRAVKMQLLLNIQHWLLRLTTMVVLMQ